MASRLALLLLIVTFVGCGDLLSFGGSGGGSDKGEAPPEVPANAVTATGALLPATPPQAPVPLPSGGPLPLSFAPLAERALPSVGTVRTELKRRIHGRPQVVAEGLGSAFVYDAEGHLLTNNHVIEDATDIHVVFLDGEEYDASVVGRDPATDVAVLKIDISGRPRPAVGLGDSDQLLVGDWVFAIGTPFGLSHSVSAGILSAKGRTRDYFKSEERAGAPLFFSEGYIDFLQTDASINPGNSGGPLLNLRSEVVGVNTAVRANANNIGFAIPINMVKDLLPLLIAEGKVVRSALGVTVDSLRKARAEELNRPDRKGALVMGVLKGGPADQAGIADDDLIIGFDGKEVRNPDDLRWRASIFGVGKVATVRVVRGTREFDVKVKLDELGTDPEPNPED
jgi:serine protease Do